LREARAGVRKHAPQAESLRNRRILSRSESHPECQKYSPARSVSYKPTTGPGHCGDPAERHLFQLTRCLMANWTPGGLGPQAASSLISSVSFGPLTRRSDFASSSHGPVTIRSHVSSSCGGPVTTRSQVSSCWLGPLTRRFDFSSGCHGPVTIRSHCSSSWRGPLTNRFVWLGAETTGVVMADSFPRAWQGAKGPIRQPSWEFVPSWQKQLP